MSQLALPFEIPPRLTLDTLVIHQGIAAAVSAAQNVYGNGARPFPSLFLYGPAGTGKTHIITAVTRLLEERSQRDHSVVEVIAAETFRPGERALKDLALKTDEELAALCCVAVDDIHLIQNEDQADLWNLSNRMTRIGAPLLMAARLSGEEAFPENPHLRSRINSGLVFALDPPQDQDRLLILDKMARDRSIRIPHEVSSYLVTRKARNIKELSNILEILDLASLELRRRITLPLIKKLEAEGRI
jgi:DnaA regulatory inactivator Hda